MSVFELVALKSKAFEIISSEDGPGSLKLEILIQVNPEKLEELTFCQVAASLFLFTIIQSLLKLFMFSKSSV